ncbi:uncharacterized Zn finger protein (UPF0148 family) [Salinibacter ruber]|uniref:GIY-YIG nuclease family protein n=1 Tax=Salinibacter ruber TaxID=146919 RepID=UPI002168650E|nr:GIY-YIG nuclease family protein [Salinibacter ruber]MCS3665615.1 uncharacterized Zn finger protein (UPF0148 family) [Salinibacter ruber]
MKRFVCEKCSTEKVKGSDFTGTRCPKCGRKMDLKSYTTQKPGTGNSETDEEKKWARSNHSWPKKAREEARKDAKSSNRDTHAEDQSTEDESDGEEWWGEGRWWSAFWVVPFVPFMSWSLIFLVGMTPLDSNSSDRIFRAEVTLEGLLLFACLSTLILSAHAWILLKEQNWKRSGPWIGAALTVAMAAYMMTRVQGPVVEKPVDAGRYALLTVSAFEYAAIVFSFLWIGGIRLAGVITSRSPQKGGAGRTGTSSRKRQFRGYVYVATNPNIKGLVKIGYTERTVEKRMKELSSSTGVPGRYKAKYKFKAVRPKQLERKVHRRLSSRRVERGGEFFKVSPERAARVIKSTRG